MEEESYPVQQNMLSFIYHAWIVSELQIILIIPSAYENKIFGHFRAVSCYDVIYPSDG